MQREYAGVRGGVRGDFGSSGKAERCPSPPLRPPVPATLTPTGEEDLTPTLLFIFVGDSCEWVEGVIVPTAGTEAGVVVAVEEEEAGAGVWVDKVKRAGCFGGIGASVSEAPVLSLAPERVSGSISEKKAGE